MTTKAARDFVTVQTVRAANGRIMSSPKGAILVPVAKSAQVSSKIREVTLAGQYAMQQHAKKK